jgi:hypothetical protein
MARKYKRPFRGNAEIGRLEYMMKLERERVAAERSRTAEARRRRRRRKPGYDSPVPFPRIGT